MGDERYQLTTIFTLSPTPYLTRELPTVRAARYHSYGTPDVLVVEDAPEPHPGENSIRIAVRATSVNQIDVLLRAGHLARVLPLELPAVPGMDAAGVVDEVGPGVTDTKVGDVVFGLGSGVSDTTAEFAVLTAWSAVPDQRTMAQAAAAGLAGATAATAIEVLGDLEGATILIEGASGAVGSAAAAFAIAAGATVIGTSSRNSFHELEAMGVIPTTYGPGWRNGSQPSRHAVSMPRCTPPHSHQTRCPTSWPSLETLPESSPCSAVPEQPSWVRGVSPPAMIRRCSVTRPHSDKPVCGRHDSITSSA